MSMNPRRPVAVVAGFMAVDIVFSDREHMIFRGIGGTAGNIALNLAFLGWDVWPVVRIGADPLGDLIRSGCEAAGLHTDYIIQESKTETPVMGVRLGRSMKSRIDHGFFLRCPSCGRFFPRFVSPTMSWVDSQLERMPNASVFIFDRATPGLLKLATHYASRGSLVYFEPMSTVDTRHLRTALSVSDVVKYSTSRLGTGVSEDDGLGQIHMVPCEIQTLGSGGARYRINGGAWREEGAISCPQFVDSAGAGDWLTSGLLAALHTIQPGQHKRNTDTDRVGQCLREAQAYAACSCMFQGAQGMRACISPDELAAAVRASAATGVTPSTSPSTCLRQTALDSCLPDRCPICLS